MEEGLRFGGSDVDELWCPVGHGGGTMANSQGKISSAIETSREELLDLGLRNPLLNHRSSRARGAEVVDELPAEIFRIRHEGRELAFFSTVATVGTPLDVIVSELVIESFFPTDSHTASVLRHF